MNAVSLVARTWWATIGMFVIPFVGCGVDPPPLTVEFAFPTATPNNQFVVEAIVDQEKGVKLEADAQGVARLSVPSSGKVTIADDHVFQTWHRTTIRIGDRLYGNDEVEVVHATATPGQTIRKVGNKSVSASTVDGTKHSVRLRITVPD